MLTSDEVDSVFEYVRAQTNKIDPVLATVQRPTFVDQLVESYISDLILFMLERLGPIRAEQFKRAHLQMHSSTQNVFGDKSVSPRGHPGVRSATHYNNLGKPFFSQTSYKDEEYTSAGGDETQLPGIDSHKSISNANLKLPKQMRRGMSLTNSEIKHGQGKGKKIPTIDLSDTKRAGSQESQRSTRSAAKELSGFDSSKWKKIIIGNVEMVQRKVDQSTPHHVLYKELDDLKTIVSNSFTQMGRSFIRQLELVREEAQQYNKIAAGKDLQTKDGHSAFYKGQPRVAAGIMSTQQSPRSNIGFDLSNIEVLQKIEKFTQDQNEITRQKYLKNIWTFDDLHEKNTTPSYIHRIKNTEVKHIQTIGETLLLLNNKSDNIDVYSADSPQVLKTLNIQGRQMNCSVVTNDKLYVGCRDRRVFIYNKFSLDLIKTLEVPESVHCMCALNDFTQVAMGMTDGHIMVLGSDEDEAEGDAGGLGDPTKITILNAAHMRDIGGIWSISGVNNDTELVVGTITGVHIVAIGVKTLTRSYEHYLKDQNIWNVCEYDDNKIICTRWDKASYYLLDRNDPQSLKKPVEIKDSDNFNKNVTDLAPIPTYDPQECPFFIVRGLKRVQLLDVKNKKLYTLYDDDNNKWGYNKVSVMDRGQGRFNLLFVSHEGGTNQVVKRFDFPNIFEEGLRKIVNLQHKQVEPGFFKRLFK